MKLVYNFEFLHVKNLICLVVSLCSKTLSMRLHRFLRSVELDSTDKLPERERHWFVSRLSGNIKLLSRAENAYGRSLMDESSSLEYYHHIVSGKLDEPRPPFHNMHDAAAQNSIPRYTPIGMLCSHDARRQALHPL